LIIKSTGKLFNLSLHVKLTQHGPLHSHGCKVTSIHQDIKHNRK